jgi:hypothetical protein
MRDRATAPAVHTFHLTRQAVLVALLGVVVIVVGLLAPLSAQAGDNQGGGVDPSAKPWICHPVEGAGETGYGWNLIDPSKASSHIDEATGVGRHTRKDGSTDVYAVWDGTSWTCPGGPTSPTTEPTSPTTEPTSPTTEPTSPTTEPSSPTTEPSSPTTEPTSPTTEPTSTTDTPSTGATTPSGTSEPAAPVEESPGEAATVAPTTPAQGEPTAEEPEVGAVEQNAVPRAQTDGADLVGQTPGWTALQSSLVGVGLLLLVAGGMLSVRREPVEE